MPESVIDLVRNTQGVKRIVLGRPRGSPVKEEHPREPHMKKGLLRKRQYVGACLSGAALHF